MPDTSPDVRLLNAERDLQSHAKTITVFTDEIARHLVRIETLEGWRHNQNVVEAREDERDKSLYQRLDKIEKSIEVVGAESKSGINAIRGFGWKIFWLVAGTCVAVFVTFTLKGGLMP